MTGIITPTMERTARQMCRHANSGLFDGTQRSRATLYFQQARREVVENGVGTVLIFTRDVGHHSSGWWKNPDYERCYHLSLSFFDPVLRKHEPFEARQAHAWISAFYAGWLRFVWEESSTLTEPERPDVRHFRVFCDARWQAFMPRGEVYSKRYTEPDWKSFSEVQAGKERHEL